MSNGSRALARALLGLALLSGATGCAALGGVYDRPARLLEQARADVEKQDFDTAYRRLKEIRLSHPGSEQDPEAFRLAAAIFKRSYLRNRLNSPDSPWVVAEPRFMLEWLASYLAGPEFPRSEAEALFVGMPYGFFREYLAFAQGRPELSRWGMRARDDNGIIEEVEAEGGTR